MKNGKNHLSEGNKTVIMRKETEGTKGWKEK